MTSDIQPRFAGVAAMIGDPTRARMLAALLDGGMLTAGEIARAAGVAPQTASAHLAKLVDAELLALRSQGRHRYFKLADADVAHALEALAMISDKQAVQRRRVWSSEAMKPLRHARTCYGHLAGQLGIRLHDELIDRRVMVREDDRYRLSAAGDRWLDELGIDARSLGHSARGVAYPCVDWSERRDHCAGPLAVALLEHFVERRWLARVPQSRALTVGPKSDRAFAALMGLDGRRD